MTEHEKLAREAAEKIAAMHRTFGYHVADVEQIILAAIEKATAKASATSEPPLKAGGIIAAAHNAAIIAAKIERESTIEGLEAALAAERSKREIVERRRDVWIAQVERLVKELAAEREKRDKMLLAIVTAKTDLVKAQQANKPLVEALEMIEYDKHGVPISYPSVERVTELLVDAALASEG